MGICAQDVIDMFGDTLDNDDQTAPKQRQETPSVPRAKVKAVKAPYPALETAIFSDYTVEALVSRLADSSRGILGYFDEGEAWVGSMNQYKAGKGVDREFFLKALYNKPHSVDRSGVNAKGRRNKTSIPELYLSVIGCLPPDLLDSLRARNGRRDGFVERILFADPDPMPPSHWNDDGVADEDQQRWDEVVRFLYAIPFVQGLDGKPMSQILDLTPDAKATFVAFWNNFSDEANGDAYESGALSSEGKLRDFTARFALSLHLLELACDPRNKPTDEIPPVSKRAIEGAIELFNYFRSTSARARWRQTGDVGPPSAQAILKWVRRNKHTRFTVKKLTDDIGWLAQRRDEMEAGLAWLVNRNAIRFRKRPEKDRSKGGRSPSPEYEVHPDVFKPAEAS